MVPIHQEQLSQLWEAKRHRFKNLEIKVKHPNYLSLRATKEIYFFITS